MLEGTAARVVDLPHKHSLVTKEHQASSSMPQETWVLAKVSPHHVGGPMRTLPPHQPGGVGGLGASDLGRLM